MQLERSRLRWWAATLAAVIVAAGILRWFVFQPYVIPSPSMEPTIMPGDHILVNRLAYRFWTPSRGDVVVFAYPKDPSRTFVKRIVAMEGETVELLDNQVFINGRAMQEPYLKPGDYPPYGPQTIPAGKVLVLGDNRRESGDSREWGLLDKTSLIGKAWLTYYPLTRMKTF